MNSLVYGLKKAIFPSVSSYHLGHDKIEMTRALQTICPEHVPYTEIMAATPGNIQTILERLPFPFIAKEVRNSMGRGVFLIENERDFRDYAAKHDILYVQEKLDIDRDIRITLVGQKVVGAYWRLAHEGNYLNNVAQGGTISFEPVPREIIDLVEAVAQALEIDHAGFDVAVENGWPYFLEFNVLFGNVGLQKLGIPIEKLIYDYLVNQTPRSTPPYSPIRPFRYTKTS